MGVSTPHAYGAIADWAADISTVADELGHERFAVVGLSGGGPYALACAALLGDRVVGAGILGGVVPSAGPDACSTGVVNLARTFTWAISAARIPLAMSLWGIIQPIIPLSHFAYRGFSSLMPPGDQEVFDDPEIEAMFIDDISHASATRFGAVVDDARLFGRDWDFRLADVKVPVHWWHGDSDSIVPLDGAEAAILQLPYATLSLRPGESHLGGFAVADEVLLTISHLF